MVMVWQGVFFGAAEKAGGDGARLGRTSSLWLTGAPRQHHPTAGSGPQPCPTPPAAWCASIRQTINCFPMMKCVGSTQLSHHWPRVYVPAVASELWGKATSTPSPSLSLVAHSRGSPKHTQTNSSSPSPAALLPGVRAPTQWRLEKSNFRALTLTLTRVFFISSPLVWSFFVDPKTLVILSS